MAQYQIQPNDTLSQIASRNNRTIAELLAVNPSINDPNRIYAGQSLTIPSTETPINPITPKTPGTTPPTVDMGQFQSDDPIRKFNLALLDMLKNAQSGQTKMGQEQAQLKREAYQSGQEVFEGEEAKMTPGAKMATLGRNVEMFEPSIQAATIRIGQLKDITDLMKTTYGEDFSSLLPVTEQDAQTFKSALQAGMTLPANILEKYKKFFTVEDFTAWAEANKEPPTVQKPPTSVQEYEYYKQQEEASGRAPKSYGEFSSSQKPATQAEQKMAGYATRLEDANMIFDRIEEGIVNYSPVNYAVQKKLPNFMKDAVVQQQEQAERNFINASLRVESGAAIAESEFESAALQYFPQPGDSSKVLKQKKANRLRQQQSFIQAAGSAYSGATGGINEIPVIKKDTGETGWIPEDEFDSSLYDKLK